MCLYTSAPTDLIVDVDAYHPSTSTYVALVPGRLLDTRSGAVTVDGAFARTGLRQPGSVTELPLAGRRGVPTLLSSAVMNVTVADARASGFVTVFPCGSTVPTASSVNFVSGQTVANAVVTKLSSTDTVCLYTSAPIHLLIDIDGYEAA